MWSWSPSFVDKSGRRYCLSWYDILAEVRAIRRTLEDDGQEEIWSSKAERQAWDAHLDETLEHLRDLAEKGLAELELEQKGANRASGS